MNKGLYFYKLVSPYSEDVTKDCKLTINEIDSNFITLKNNEISNMYVDNEEKKVVLTRENGEELIANLTEVVEHTLDVDYDSVDGILEITYDGNKYMVKGLVTKDNLSKEILTKVYSNSTLEGVGTSAAPLSIASTQKTGHFKAAIALMDTTMNERLPHNSVKKGDRYVTIEEMSDYGMLYNYDGVRRINDLLEKSGWRVATKNDWDSMLNAIEPCEYRNHTSPLNGDILGHMAGSLLKSVNGWRTHDAMPPHHGCDKPSHKPHGELEGDLEFGELSYGCHDKHGDSDLEIMDKYPQKPNEPQSSSKGQDAYGMGILPSGHARIFKPVKYHGFGFEGEYWTSDRTCTNEVYTKAFEANESGVRQNGKDFNVFLSIRLVKDYDGTNHSGVENILGDNYETVLMPSYQNPNGYAIWTAQNLRLRERSIETIIPNAGLGIERRKVYYINEWNGFKWEKIELCEGDSITILKGKTRNEVYRVIDGALVNVTERIYDRLHEDLKKHIDNIYCRILGVEHGMNCMHHHHCHEDKDGVSLLKRIIFIEDEIRDIKHRHKADVKLLFDKFKTLETKSDEDIKNLTEKVEEIETKINDLENSFAEAKEELSAQIDAETERAKEAEKALEEVIEVEKSTREAADNTLQENINKEAEEREKAVEEEKTAREEADATLQANIEGTEQKLNEKIDSVKEELTETITAEKERAEKVEGELLESIEELQDSARNIEGKIETLEDTITKIDGELIVNEGSEYDASTGLLTLKSKNGESDINIQFGFNFGTF